MSSIRTARAAEETARWTGTPLAFSSSASAKLGWTLPFIPTFRTWVKNNVWSGQEDLGRYSSKTATCNVYTAKIGIFRKRASTVRNWNWWRISSSPIWCWISKESGATISILFLPLTLLLRLWGLWPSPRKRGWKYLLSITREATKPWGLSRYWTASLIFTCQTWSTQIRPKPWSIRE